VRAASNSAGYPTAFSTMSFWMLIMAKQNFDYDKIYTAGWKDAMEEMDEKMKKEQVFTEQLQTMVLLLLEKNKEMSKRLELFES